MYKIQFGGQSAIKFLDWIYTDSSLKLERKYDKYMLAKQMMQDKENRKFGKKTLKESLYS